MKKNEASSTAALVALIVALRWHTGDDNAKLQAELLRNVSWRHMSLPFWILMRVLLCHPLISRFALYWIDWEKTGVWLRKEYMERQVRTFVDEQLQESARNNQSVQVVILASGYDTLAWRLCAEYPKVNFIEVDHPATGRAKKHALHMTLLQRAAKVKSGVRGGVCHPTNAFQGCKIPESLYFCHEAIGKKYTLQDALKNNIVQASALFSCSKENDMDIDIFSQMSSTVNTAIVMEGLVAYLSHAEVTRVFQELGQVFGKGKNCLLAFNFLTLNDIVKSPRKKNTKSDNKAWMGILRPFVRMFGEPFKWGIAPEDLPSFFEGTGWDIVPAKHAWPESKDEECEYATLMGIEYETTLTWSGID